MAIAADPAVKPALERKAVNPIIQADTLAPLNRGGGGGEVNYKKTVQTMASA